MRQPENSAVTGKDGSETGPPGGAPMSPVRAFLLLMALLVTAGVVLWTTTRPERAEPIRMDHSQDAAGNGETKARTPSRQEGRPTKAEAKSIFERLDQARIRAYRHRSLTALHDIWTENSPVRPVVEREIRRMRHDTVLMRTNFDTKRLTVTALKSSKIRLTQVVRVDPKFVSESGEDVTVGKLIDKDTVKWVLLEQRGKWLIHNATVIERKKLDDKAFQ